MCKYSFNTNPIIPPATGARIKIAIGQISHVDIPFAANASTGFKNVKLVFASVKNVEDSVKPMYRAINIAKPAVIAAATFSRFNLKAEANPKANMATASNSAKNRYHSLPAVIVAAWNNDAADDEYKSTIAGLAPFKKVVSTNQATVAPNPWATI